MLTIKDLSITRGQGEQSFTVSLPHLSLAEGEVVSLCGSSGCGKSTLLEMMGLILKPDNLSQYELRSATLSMDLAPLILSDKQKTLAEIRSKNLGFMLQNGGLLPFLSVWQNILLPCQTNGILADESWLHHLCEKLNINHLMKKVTHDWDLVQRNELRTFSAKLDMSLRQSCFIEQANND